MTKKKKFYNVKEVSAIIGRTKQTIRNWVRFKKLPPECYRALYGTNGKILELCFTEQIFAWLNPERKAKKNITKAKNRQAKKMLKKIVE